MRLADERSAVTRVVQHLGDGRRVDRKGNAVHPHAVRAGMLAGEDRRSRRHAHDRLRNGALVADALCREAVDHRCAGERSTVAPERVVPLLVGGDEQDLAAHQVAPSIVSRRCSRALPAAPAMTRAIVDGLASAAYTTTLVPSPASSTSSVERCSWNMGAVIRYWNRRWTSSWVTISSGIGSPLAIVITRVVPSTVDDTMPGNHSWILAGSPMRAHTSSGGRAMCTWRRMLPRGAVTCGR